MTQLSVNLNAVAQLRNRRDLPWPSVTGIARVVLDAGAAGITVHPRPDERHIRRTDVFDLSRLLRDSYPDAEFNIEGYPSPEFLDLVAQTQPDQVTFVPDDPAQATSDHGWAIERSRAVLQPAIARMRELGVRISLFIDADPSVPAEAQAIGADRVELFTGPYGGSFEPETRTKLLHDLADTAKQAVAAGLGINAGHDLTLDNLPDFVAAVPRLDEVSIGHAITADALLYGFADAVRRYNKALRA